MPPRFVVQEAFAERAIVNVDETVVRHMRVLRLAPGARVVLLDGEGSRAAGIVQTLGKRGATVLIDAVDSVPPLAPVHALVPVADRERMLLLAEKAAELSLTSWRPVLWVRSKSVSPRGDGPSIQNKIRARMAAALEQSGNAWFPVMHPSAPLERAIAALPSGLRLVLDAGGAMIDSVLGDFSGDAIIVAIGPEGGFADDELAALDAAGFSRVSLGPTTLRFETAGIVAIATARAALARAHPIGG